jgi:hypothetical protein
MLLDGARPFAEGVFDDQNVQGKPRAALGDMIKSSVLHKATKTQRVKKSPYFQQALLRVLRAFV